MSTVTFTMTCKPFASEKRQAYKIAVTPTSDVLVWDSVAGHYTTCHELPAGAVRVALARAAKIRH